MRSSLKDRLEELNRLLEVSQGVASSLEFSSAVEPVLASALSLGASCARVVLKSDVLPELGGFSSEPFTQGAGPAADLYTDLDPQILYFIGQQDQLERLALPDVKRPRLFDIPSDAPHPASLLAVALRHDNSYYGVLWIAYDERHEFSEEEVRFLVTLGGQAALAAANAHLYLQSEIERQRLDAILSSSPDPILVTDQRNRLMLANPAAWQVLQIGIENDSDQLIDELLPDEDLVELMLSTTEGAQVKEIGFSDGKVYLATATTVVSQETKVGRVCIMRDITALKELDTLKSEFVSTVSHDLRSPLTLMRGYATMLEMVGELNEQQEDYVRKIVGGVESMTHLVNNLLDLGRIESGIALNLELISPGEVVNQVVSSLKLQAIQKRIEMVTEFEEDLPEVEADKALLQQALHNLIENGIKFSQTDGKVTISAKSTHKIMIFRVHDNGIGISPMDQQHLFEKFNRLTQKSSEDKRGSGLGLAIVKSIADRHGGSVKVKSQLGKGSTFFLELPLRQPSKAE
jgi:PAS domain S-box-containing protein